MNLAANYSECQDDIAEYQRVLNDSSSTTKDVQKAQKKLAKAIENAEWRKVTKNIKNYLDELENVVEGSEEMYEIYEDMAGAINDAFGTDVGTEFIEDNIDLIKKWSKATGDEATELAM
jgi:chromosome segregation ATPase